MNLNYKYFKGMNEAVDEALVQDDSTCLVNATVRNGVLSPVKGASVWRPNLAPLPNLNKIFRYSRGVNGSYSIHASTDKALYNWTGDTWTLLKDGFTNGNFDSVNNNIDDRDIIIYSNGVDPVFKIDSTSYQELKLKGKDSDYNEEGNRAPKGSKILLHHDRLWVASDTHIACSSVTADKGIDVEDFTVPTFPESEVNRHGAEVFMYCENDYTPIKAFQYVFGDIMIWKGQSLFRIYGTSPQNYQKDQMFNASGAASDAVVVYSKGAIFIDTNGIYIYNGSGVEKISQRIDRTWKAKVDTAKLNEATATFYDSRYIVALYNKTTGKRDLIFEWDTIADSWSIREDKEVICFLDMLSNMLLFSSTDGLIYRYDSGNYLPMKWSSPVITTGEGAIEVEEIKLSTIGTGELKVSVESEKKTKIKNIPITKNGVKIKMINNSGRNIKFTVETKDNIILKSLVAVADVDKD